MTTNLQDEIITALKTYGVLNRKDLKGYTTKKDVRNIVLEATDTILSGMEEMFKNVPTKQEFNEKLKNIENKIDNQSKEFVKKKDFQRIFAS